MSVACCNQTLHHLCLIVYCSSRKLGMFKSVVTMVHTSGVPKDDTYRTSLVYHAVCHGHHRNDNANAAYLSTDHIISLDE